MAFLNHLSKHLSNHPELEPARQATHRSGVEAFSVPL